MRPQDRHELATRSDIADLGRRVEDLEQRLEKIENRLWKTYIHGEFRKQTRAFIVTVITAMLGVGSLTLAAAALLQ